VIYTGASKQGEPNNTVCLV